MIEGPGNDRRTVRADEQGGSAGCRGAAGGRVYVDHMASGAAPRREVGLSLLSPTETSLAVVDQLQFNDELTVTAATAPVKSDRTLWWGIALAALLALLVEWWWFQRRMV